MHIDKEKLFIFSPNAFKKWTNFLLCGQIILPDWTENYQALATPDRSSYVLLGIHLTNEEEDREYRKPLAAIEDKKQRHI
jgi:hypothetical protein